MIEHSVEDLKFKESPEFIDKRDNFLSAAHLLDVPQPEIINNSVATNTDSLIEAIASFCCWSSAADGLSDYVYSRIMIFEHEQRTNHEIADWLRRLARKIELSPNDISFKNSPNMPSREQIELAAQALENTKRQQTLDGDLAIGERRSSVGVLLDFMKVHDKLWDGGTLALSENISEAIIKRNQTDSEDKENLQIAKQELNSWLTHQIVNRIIYFDGYERFSLKEIAQWLRLFLAD
jgi:hypothetical protein